MELTYLNRTKKIVGKHTNHASGWPEQQIRHPIKSHTVIEKRCVT